MSGGLEVAEEVVRRKKEEAEQEETHNEVLLLVVGIQLEEEGHTHRKVGVWRFVDISFVAFCLCVPSLKRKNATRMSTSTSRMKRAEMMK